MGLSSSRVVSIFAGIVTSVAVTALSVLAPISDNVGVIPSTTSSPMAPVFVFNSSIFAEISSTKESTCLSMVT